MGGFWGSKWRLGPGCEIKLLGESGFWWAESGSAEGMAGLERPWRRWRKATRCKVCCRRISTGVTGVFGGGLADVVPVI